MGRISSRRKVYLLMYISQAIESIVTKPAVGANFRTKFQCNYTSHEWNLATGREIEYALHSDASVSNRLMDLQSNDCEIFSLGTSSSFSSSIFSAHNGFVYLYNATKLMAVRPYHRPSDFVKPTPRRLVAPKAKHLLEIQSASPKFLAGNQMAWNHNRRGFLVPWNIVLARTDVFCLHLEQRISPFAIFQPFVPLQPGRHKPSGQRIREDMLCNPLLPKTTGQTLAGSSGNQHHL